MLRINSISKYEAIVRQGLQELFDTCKQYMRHSGDLLLCQQNGHIDFGGHPCVGMGREGFNNLQKINSISNKGIGKTTEDDNYFIKFGSDLLNGTSELEKEIHKEKYTYLDIWENTYFLRIFTQVINVLNGCDYDWYLDISKLPPSGKSKHIREQIINRLVLVPKFQEIARTAYVGQIRNAIAHTQYHCIQGGIMYDNYKSDKYALLQGLSFEEWEKKYIYSFFIFNGFFQSLKQLNDEFYVPVSKITMGGGVPVRIPNREERWVDTYLFPNENGSVWRFVKTK